MTAPARILVADDDDALRELMWEILSDAGHRVHAVRDGKEALAALSRGSFDLVLSDVRMPEADGMTVLRALQRRAQAPPVVLMTAFGTVPQAVQAIQAGAFDYLTKPLKSPAVLRDVVERALTSHQREGEAEPAPSPRGRQTTADGGDFVFEDPRSRETLRLFERVARRDTTVLLLGESGVGKEVGARLIHTHSPRADGPFVAVNCGAIPADLWESHLFGHAKGAFTGAATARKGVFEEADGGTLFLDEVGELPLMAQVKLLRALEERRVVRVGEVHERRVDARIIAATNRDLHAEVDAGRFREDLYYRLNVFPIELAPLRERPGDIPALARVCLDRLGERDVTLAQDALEAMQAHAWPGNVRELRNVIERALVLAGDGPIRAQHLRLSPSTRSGPSAATARARQPASLKDMERRAILDALEATGGNRREAAERLGIALRTLQYKLKAYGLTQRG